MIEEDNMIENEVFAPYDDDFGKFQDVLGAGKHPDLYAMNLLARIFPEKSGKIIINAIDNEIEFNVSSDELRARALDWMILDLHRCGVMSGKFSDEPLRMFV